jgi:CHAD domain-containing protein
MPLSSLKDYRDELRKAWKKARHGLDEESIHDLRVASRRMGSSLLLLESVLLEERSSKARRRIKRLMKKLGPLRDIQVQILIVKKWQRTGNVQHFGDSLERAEWQERDRVRDYLSQHRRQGILRDLRDFEKDAAKRLQKIPQATIQARIRSELSVQRMDLEAARKAMVPSDPSSLHAVRKTARRLRYCLEAAGEIVGTAPHSEVQRLRKYQTELGNKRDLQLLEAKFEEWQRGNRGQAPRFPISRRRIRGRRRSK